MKKNLVLLILSFYLVVLTGCAEFGGISDSTARTRSSSSTQVESKNKEPADDPSLEKEKEIETKAPTMAPIIENSSVKEPVLSGAPLQLIKQAEEKYNQGEYPSAAALAERALRIQPKSPQIYHLLAETRLKMGLIGEAKQLALRGKSYTSAGSMLQIKLNDLLLLINNMVTYN